MTAECRRLAAVVPAVGGSFLDEKLADLARIREWLDLVVVCFNGPESELEVVRQAADRAPLPVRVSVSPPFGKARALSDGLGLVGERRVLYTDVDCLIHGEPRDLAEVVKGSDVFSFLVLRSLPRGERAVRWKLLRRRFLGRMYDRIGLPYLCVRGGGYVTDDLREVIQEQAMSDDLLFSAEHAARSGRRIVPSEALVFYEAADARPYVDKLPRLIFGTFQAFRLARSGRVRMSLLVQKILKYTIVALAPAIAVGVLWLADLPVWLAAVLIVRWRMFVHTWEGVARGVLGKKPRW